MIQNNSPVKFYNWQLSARKQMFETEKNYPTNGQDIVFSNRGYGTRYQLVNRAVTLYWDQY